MQEFTDDQTDAEKWEGEFKALDQNPNVFEWYCEKCHTAHPPTATITACCPTMHVEKIFVGKTPCDGDAWAAAGTLLELVERAAVIIKAQGDELDKCHARDVSDENTIAELRAELVEWRKVRGAIERAHFEAIGKHMAAQPGVTVKEWEIKIPSPADEEWKADALQHQQIEIDRANALAGELAETIAIAKRHIPIRDIPHFEHDLRGAGIDGATVES